MAISMRKALLILAAIASVLAAYGYWPAPDADEELVRGRIEQFALAVRTAARDQSDIVAIQVVTEACRMERSRSSRIGARVRATLIALRSTSKVPCSGAPRPFCRPSRRRVGRLQT